MLEYINRQPIDHNIFNFQLANTKPQILASNNQIREYRMKTKTNHYTIKITHNRK